MFDGAVARATGTTSPLGAFMDSVFDRWGEGVVYVGIVIGATRAGLDIAAWLAAAAMVSAFMVSYARSKSEGLGFSSGTGMAAIGLAPREVRTVILGSRARGRRASSGSRRELADAGTLFLAGGLALIAVLATLTVIQRIRYVVTQSQRARTISHHERHVQDERRHGRRNQRPRPHA